MIESNQDRLDPTVEMIAREARQPVQLAADLRARIMDAVRATPLPERPRRGFGWLTAPRQFALSPLGSSLLAAGLVGIGVLGALVVTHRDGTPVAPAATAVAAGTTQAADTVIVHEFVLKAPSATAVSLVGDFNAWNSGATPMQRNADGTWSVKVKLPAGLHRYQFEVDGSNGNTFVPDPSGLRAPNDGFGPTSVVLVGQGSAT